jgi:phosphoglycolate phosphatase-like HAD superfamily hydrolase
MVKAGFSKIMRKLNYPWLEVINPDVKVGGVRFALFDFDGTLSVIRQGWEKIMAAVMLESICEDQPPTAEIEAEVTYYVDQSTGILTIRQMKWLEAAVKRHGIAKNIRTASAYKRIYLDRLLEPVYERLGQIDDSQAARQNWMVAGASDFLLRLNQEGVMLFLASGTDQEYVLKEAEALGIAHFFQGRIYGAQGDLEDDSKEMVMQRILEEHRLPGKELLVVGDGPVEIRAAHQAGAVAFGVACDETDRTSLDERKRLRLLQAGADLIVRNFLHSAELVELLCSD